MFIEELNLDLNKPDFKSFSNELKFINSIHKKIIININNKEGIEIKNTREPKDIYLLKKESVMILVDFLKKFFNIMAIKPGICQFMKKRRYTYFEFIS